MSQIVEEPEDYENQEDNHTTNSTTNGGSDWRGNPYPSRPCMWLLRNYTRLTDMEYN